MKRLLAVVISGCLVSSQSVPAWADAVTTQQLLEQDTEQMHKTSLVSALDREEVRQKLIELGVDPDFARLRIAALNDARVDELHASMDVLPAGSGVLEALVAVLLVLVILDVVGVTNVFSFIHPPR